MIDWIWGLATNFEFNSMLALFIYWVPLSVCAGVYFLRGVNLYRQEIINRDIADKEKFKIYRPTLTVGLIIWYFLVTICPVGNLCAMIFDCASSVFSWINRAFNIPLVPARKKT